MGVNVTARVVMAHRFEEALKQAPDISSAEIAVGMEESVATVKAEVRRNIYDQGLVKSGELLRTVRGRVLKGKRFKAIRGFVNVGSRGRGRGFYAPALEQGATIRPKKGKYLVIRFRDIALITHVGDRELKRARRETVAERWVKLKQVTIKPRRFFVSGVRSSQERIEDALNRAANRAMSRIFEGR